MKYHFFILLSALFFVAQSQNLSLKTIHQNSTRGKVVNESYLIKIYTKNDTTIMDSYHIIDSATLRVNDDTIKIEDIQKMYIKNNLSTGFGIGLTIYGSTSLLSGSLLVGIFSGIETGSFITSALIVSFGYVAIFGGIVMLFPGVLLLVNGSKYSGKEYLFKIE